MLRRVFSVFPAVATVACVAIPATGMTEVSFVCEAQELPSGREEARKKVQTIREYGIPAAQSLGGLS